jgi:hypothetical protein
MKKANVHGVQVDMKHDMKKPKPQSTQAYYQKDIKHDMKKPKPQSTQAPSCTTFLHKAFSLF